MVAEGISSIRRDRARTDRFRQRLLRADLAARAAAEGLAGLSDEERYDLHLSMFRAAFDQRAQGTPLVATGRNAGADWLAVTVDGQNGKANRHLSLAKKAPLIHRTSLRSAEIATTSKRAG